MSVNEQLRSYVIERNVPGAGTLSPQELAAIARKSCSVLDGLGPSIQWIHSYVTADRVYCVYASTDPALLQRHAELGGFPCDRISRVESIIDPSTATE
jgi:hypothetical protein